MEGKSFIYEHRQITINLIDLLMQKDHSQVKLMCKCIEITMNLIDVLMQASCIEFN